MEGAVPLLVMVRDILGLCDIRREAKAIIRSRQIKVDNRVVTDIRFPVGLMDRLTLLTTKEHFHILVNRQGMLVPRPVPPSEAAWKLVRVEGKRTLRGGVYQINTHDGRCFQMKVCRYRPGDVLKVSLPEQRVQGHVPFTKGAIAYIIGGGHVGECAHISSIDVADWSRPNTVRMEEGISTTQNNVFVIGTKRPLVNVDIPPPRPSGPPPEDTGTPPKEEVSVDERG